MSLREYKVANFDKGLVTKIKDRKAIPVGASPDSLNWLTLGDRIELRHGMQRLGDDQTGSGKIWGLGVGRKADATEVPFLVDNNGKLRYYNSTTELLTDIITLPAAAVAEDFSFSNYHNLAGAFIYGSSKNSSIYKIPVANAGSSVDQLMTTHRGHIKIKTGRMYLWDRKDTTNGRDQTSLYGSYVDKDELSDYTAITSEAIGSAGSLTYTGTLAFKGAGAKRTCMYVSFTDGVETFRDDRNGLLVGSAGGTGTINYATGAYSITFNAVAAGSVTSDYYWEDSTSAGICDFTKSTPRTAGQGFVLQQPEGGIFQNLFSIGDSEYCFHETQTRKVNISFDDADAANLIYRQRVGIPYWLAATETGEGIPYVDTSETSNTRIRILTFDAQNDQVVPISISDLIDLSDYRFDKAVLVEWGEYHIVACRSSDSTENNTMFVRHKIWKTWDRLDYFANRLDIYNGALIAGDSISNNLWTLFSGFDEDGAVINNYWTGGELDLGIPGVKRFYDLIIEGFIAPGQKMEVSLAYDNGTFGEVGGSDDALGNHTYAIDADGDYVDRNQSISVGATVVGSKEVGGGGDSSSAYYYRRQIRVATDLFEHVRPRFEAIDVGYVSVNSITFLDVRPKGSGVAAKYRNAS